MKAKQIKKQILELTREYFSERFSKIEFMPGETYVNYSGRVFDAVELENLIDSSLDFWLTSGRYAAEFERRLSGFLGVRHTSLTNSGSSANLLALSALTSDSLGGRKLRPGDEVITIGAGFPTTVNPIFQNNLKPVFCDIDLGTNNININQLRESISEKTRAIFLAHTLGNPFNIEEVLNVKEKYDLWVIEDNCDALGSIWDGKYTGTFGDLATESFYPPHHITMGEGGAVVTDSPKLKRIVESFRDWGRDCWCASGADNTCGKRFEWQLGNLPYGYDHKYIYSHIGYNLKLTDMQAAVGVAQLEKLPAFIRDRKENFEFYYKFFKKYEDFFYLPKWEEKADPSWFGFFLTVKEDAPFSRHEIVSYLETKKIATRMLFGGNITKQQAYINKDFRIVYNLKNTDIVMNNGFWIGVYPGLDDSRKNYVIEMFHGFFKNYH